MIYAISHGRLATRDLCNPIYSTQIPGYLLAPFLVIRNVFVHPHRIRVHQAVDVVGGRHQARLTSEKTCEMRAESLLWGSLL